MRVAGRSNPFNELYLSEAIDDPALYLRWFSPTILKGQAAALFRQGNTVLRGGNGVGKTMLLRLFSPRVRASYWRHEAEVAWEIPMGNAVGIAVNFIHAGFGSLGGRRLDTLEENNRQQWALIVGDLLNYYLTNELLKTLRFLEDDGVIVAERVGADVGGGRLDEFARLLAGRDCWFGGLDGVGSFKELTVAVRRRIEAYWSFVNWNAKRLSPQIARTKTVIGAPLMEARDALDCSGVLSKNIALVVTLDQYETLFHADYADDRPHELSLGRAFCRVVNSLLALRSPRISYKVGVRHYAWGREQRGLNTDAALERGRDYHLVDLDELLRRPENRKAWIFPDFAEDVAGRRMAATLGYRDESAGKWLKSALEALAPDEEIDRYSRGDRERLIPRALGDKWPQVWKTFLRELYGKSKYKAKLAEVWMRQKRGGRGDALLKLPEEVGAPWERPWWEKERREALLTQIASGCAQRRLYSGWDSLLTLSGSNILVFISLCREMWDHWERAQRGEGEAVEQISADLQSQAVRIVASGWLEKQEEFPRGSTRRAFIVRLGIGMRKALLGDRGLAYPGRTGFSLTEDELAGDDFVRGFLEDAVDYGALVSVAHTTKERDGKKRRKWYLAPILCPNFEIPAIRTKEPYYARVAEVHRWIAGDEVIVGSGARRRASEGRGEGWLFDEEA